MTLIHAIIALMRLNKPVGIYLLWFPTAWALSLAYPHHPPLDIYILFMFGTLVMRSAGCVINDIADRKWDKFVTRTQDRPLANQTLSLQAAILCFLILIFFAIVILLQLPKNCFYGAIPAVLLTLIYPFCKRFFVTPQLILGFAFASSIPMVALASDSSWTSSWSLLLLITISWVLVYDTQYALVDLKDDKRVGILSTARFFEKNIYLFINGLQLFTHSLWLVFAYVNHKSQLFYLGWALAIGFGICQFLFLKNNQPFKAFKNNVWYGLWMWLTLLVA